MQNDATKSQRGAQSKTRKEAYIESLFGFMPMYSTRLVREADFTYAERTQLRSPEDVAMLLTEYFRDKDREESIVLLLDTSNSVIGLVRSSVGGLAASIVEPRQVFKAAILANAAAVILVHNHITGNPEPSREDIRISRQLVEAGKVMGIPLHDHLIIAESNYTSLAERGLLTG